MPGGILETSFHLCITWTLPFSLLVSMREQKGLDWLRKSCSFTSLWQGLSTLKDDLMLVLGAWSGNTNLWGEMVSFSFNLKTNVCNLVSPLSTLLISYCLLWKDWNSFWCVLWCLKLFLSVSEWKFSTFLFVLRKLAFLIVF